MSYSPTVYSASIATPSAFARARFPARPGVAGRSLGHRQHRPFLDASARIPVEVLDQSRRGKRVEVIHQRFVGYVDLFALDECRHGNHHGKLARLSLEVVDHGDDGFVVAAHEYDLRRFVEQLSIGFGDIEPAKGADGWTRSDEGEYQ